MGKLYDAIDDSLQSFLSAQHMFFVSTAPSGDDGHVNCSPKGLDTFRILGPTTVAYLDFAGSGVETIAHLRQNGRIVMMFCAFDGAPRIVRLHGRGTVIEATEREFDALAEHFPDPRHPGARAIIRVEVTRIADSCGFGVPLYRYEGQREQLPLWAGRKTPEAMRTYQRTKNAASIDGLEGLEWVAKER